jgi:hypothetical protein
MLLGHDELSLAEVLPGCEPGYLCAVGVFAPSGLPASDRAGRPCEGDPQRLLQQLLPEGEKVAVYWRNYVGYFTVQEYSEILLTLKEGARRRLLGTIRT